VQQPLAMSEKEKECWSTDLGEDHAYIERFNRTIRYDWLIHYIYADIEKLQNKAMSRLWTYNNERPNMGVLACQRLKKLTKSMNSTPEFD
jgi:putative transposase